MTPLRGPRPEGTTTSRLPRTITSWDNVELLRPSERRARRRRFSLWSPAPSLPAYLSPLRACMPKGAPRAAAPSTLSCPSGGNRPFRGPRAACVASPPEPAHLAIALVLQPIRVIRAREDNVLLERLAR